MEQKQQTFSIWYFIATMMIIAVMQMYLPSERPEIIDYSQFKSLVKHSLVSDLVVTDTTIRGKIQPAGMREIYPEQKLKELKYDGKSPYGFTTVRVSDPELTADLERAGISFKGEVGGNWLPTVLSWVVPVILFVVVWTYLMKRMGGGAAGMMQIGKSKAKVYIEKKTGVTFADVEGIDEAKEELVEVVEFLKSPEKYQRLGGHIPKGVLLLGPPGTGKTLLARAVAGEAGVPFFSISGSDFVEMFVGVGAARVRDLFAQAAEHAPSIIFIDELDALGKEIGRASCRERV